MRKRWTPAFRKLGLPIEKGYLTLQECYDFADDLVAEKGEDATALQYRERVAGLCSMDDSQTYVDFALNRFRMRRMHGNAGGWIRTR